MKKVICIVSVIVLLFLVLGSCGTEKKDNKENKPTLTIWYLPTGNNQLTQIVSNATRVFKEIYDVEVVYYPEPTSDMMKTENGEAMYYQKLNTEIMSGKGPDLFMMGASSFVEFDIYKKMDSGMYLDINELINKDKGFSLDDYESTIMDVGVYKEKRYAIPINYSMPLLITTKDKMDECGIIGDDFTEYERFIDTFLRLQGTYRNSRTHYTRTYSDLFIRYGWNQECMDFETGEIDLGSSLLRKSMDLYRNEFSEVMNLSDSPNREEGYYDDLLILSINLYEQAVQFELLKESIDNIEVFTIPNNYGKATVNVTNYCMLSSSSEKKDLAWNYLKLILSEDFQKNQIIKTRESIGVRRDSFDEGFNNAIKEVIGHGRISDEWREKLKNVYRTADNAVFVNNPAGHQVLIAMSDFTDNNCSYEEAKSYAESYLKIWLSE